MFDGVELAADGFADAADVDLLAVIIGGLDSAASEDLSAGNAVRLAAELGDHFHQSRIDGVAEGLLNNGDGFWGGDAEATNEFCL